MWEDAMGMGLNRYLCSCETVVSEMGVSDISATQYEILR